MRDVDQHVVGAGDHGVEQHAVAVAALAAGADVDALLHQRLGAAAGGAVALTGAGQLEVDGVGGGELLGALDEGGRLVLVVGALRLREQLADAVDEPVAGRSAGPRRRSQLPHLDGELAVVDPQGERRLGAEHRLDQQQHERREGRRGGRASARSSRRRGGPARAAGRVSRSAHGSPCTGTGSAIVPGGSQWAARTPRRTRSAGGGTWPTTATTSGSASTRAAYAAAAVRHPQRRVVAQYRPG